MAVNLPAHSSSARHVSVHCLSPDLSAKGFEPDANDFEEIVNWNHIRRHMTPEWKVVADLSKQMQMRHNMPPRRIQELSFDNILDTFWDGVNSMPARPGRPWDDITSEARGLQEYDRRVLYPVSLCMRGKLASYIKWRSGEKVKIKYWEKYKESALKYDDTTKTVAAKTRPMPDCV
jgi:hypothetical protein